MIVNKWEELRDYFIARHDARDVASWFILRSRDEGKEYLPIGNVLRLCFVAHGWHLEMKGKPLFRNKVTKWVSGPIIDIVYEELKYQGKDITRVLPPVKDSSFNKDDDLFLEDIWNTYSDLNVEEFDRIVRYPEGSWDRAKLWERISNDSIRDEFIKKREIIKKQKEGKETGIKDSVEPC